MPLSFLLSPGQHADSRYLVPVMEQIRLQVIRDVRASVADICWPTEVTTV
ncbi:hypothetical protein [Modicisalibacter luteus]|uniref:Uncharacterized protein n=1 Tax=Modicisalibacter luteus TaxID=453962 RepID=A0ABV7M8E8_9GAMM|nr:hypothetical protein [Halomonas lutea]